MAATLFLDKSYVSQVRPLQAESSFKSDSPVNEGAALMAGISCLRNQRTTGALMQI